MALDERARSVTLEHSERALPMGFGYLYASSADRLADAASELQGAGLFDPDPTENPG